MKKNIPFFLLALLPLFSLADPTTDLATAVKQHNIDAMKTAIAAGADVNAFDANGNPPLNCAVWFPDEVKILIDAKADVNLKNPLIGAVTWGEFATCELLVKAGANVNVSDALGHSVLWLAAFNGNQASILKLLLDAGADANFKDKDGVTPLIVLAMSGKSPSERVATIKSQAPYLEKAGLILSERLKNPKESDYSTVGEMMTVLINGKADVNARVTVSQMTALMWAAKNNRVDAVQSLIDNKADLNLLSSTKAPALSYACDSKKGEESGILLVKSGANVNVVHFFGLEALRNGRTVNAEFKNVTPLMLACVRGYANLVQSLIDAKADVNVIAEGTDWKYMKGFTLDAKETAAKLAKAYGFTNIFDMLVKVGGKY